MDGNIFNSKGVHVGVVRGDAVFEGNKNAARNTKRAARLMLDGWARKP